MNTRNLFIGAGVLVAVAFVLVFIVYPLVTLKKMSQPEQLISYADPVSGISFEYPKSLDPITPVPANDMCPEEDTYRTADSLTIRDESLQFADYYIWESESFIRSGILTYRLDPNNLPDCHYEALKLFATGVAQPEAFSSVRLVSVNVNGLKGFVNENASRLDTESRVQYTLFSPNDDGTFTVIQPYFSFIPYADSPEWKEIDAKFKNNISGYVKEGETADVIRRKLEAFHAMVRTLHL